MGTYFPISDNPRHSATMSYLRDRFPDSQPEPPIYPTNDPIMYTNYSSVDLQPSHPNASRQDILFNFGSLQTMGNQWKESRDDVVVMMGPADSCVLQGGPNPQGQGLSLSLGSNVPSLLQMPSIHYPNHGATDWMINPIEGGDGYTAKQMRDGDYMGVANEIAPLGPTGIARAVSSYKYLRAAQELLNEVVSVRDVRGRNAKKENLKDSKENEGDGATPKASGNSSVELSMAGKQELQSKLSKLLEMLDEVDRRYRQYSHQMQIVVSSFDAMAGPGTAKPYTSLALQTISSHFRCLRDAINAQIRTARKSLGEDDASSGNADKGIGISRLCYVDKQLRQQRALQQLGIMQQHAWRPQRGLPETSVSILRAWLFEHFLHPYPKDSEKIMLARQAGLTRSQVSNWFINARVRLWKPMVEEMYKEETGDADADSNSSSEKICAKDKDSDPHLATASTGSHLTESKPTNPMANTEIGGPDEEGRNGLFAERDSGLYMSELGRFGGVVDPVSLSLGLQQGEDGSSNEHGFIQLREGVGYHDVGAAMADEAAEFEYMVNSGNRQLPFVSSLLPSFS